MTLRLVPKPGEGQDPPRRRPRSRASALLLTPDESRHLRASIRNLARAYGSIECLAEVIGVRRSVLARKRRPSAALALAVARAGGVSVESLLSGAVTLAGACSTCGHRPATGRIAAGGAS